MAKPMTLLELADDLQAIIDGERPRLNKTEMREYVSNLRHLAQPAERVVDDGASRIAAERQRQKAVEGWTPEHDAGHGNATLTKAAICYAIFAAAAPSVRDDVRHMIPADWPWENAWWKPGADNGDASRIRELEKAGALIAAEIDRLAAAPSPGASHG